MEYGSALLWVAGALGAGAVGVLRYAWSQPRRVRALNVVAWAMLLGALLCGGWLEGAWGISIVSLAIIGAAFVSLAIAGIRSPSGRRVQSDRRSGMTPQPAAPRRVGRRFATFLLVMPGGLAASIALGLAMRGSGMALEWGEANANVAALYTVPLAWAMLATIVLMQADRRRQIATLLACGLVGVPFLLTGFGS
ncbi:hypothetical protein [Sphingomonas sp.]|jgi:small neutral amino acid transporter SnatA (MarC family)|uniref:hypothetical protein n=1 Tax=Sphingomonas sp. TaxID=28214 RepID=UPI002EDAD0C3